MPRRARRTFTPEFKARAVLDVLAGTASQAEVCRKHQISPTPFALWKSTLLERLPVVFQADERQSAAAARVAELERLEQAVAAVRERVANQSSPLSQSRRAG